MNSTTLPMVYLQPGEMHFASKPVAVTTVLGSCVSVTLHEPSSGMGAICHGLLPSCANKDDCALSCNTGLRFVECAIHRMLTIFRNKGIRRQSLEVKLFGGADVLMSQAGRSGLTVGRQNLIKAYEVIGGEGMRIASEDVGGCSGRKIIFFPATGEVLLKRLAAGMSSHDRPVMKAAWRNG